jgi:hypothetical protein
MKLSKIDYFENGPQTIYRGCSKSFKDGHIVDTDTNPDIPIPNDFTGPAK